MTSLYRGMDTGEQVDLLRFERCLAPQRVLSGVSRNGRLAASIARWECDTRGVPAPISVNLALWEDEDCYSAFPYSCSDGYEGGVIDSADGLIGRAEWTFTPRWLASILDHVGEARDAVHPRWTVRISGAKPRVWGRPGHRPGIQSHRLHSSGQRRAATCHTGIAVAERASGGHLYVQARDARERRKRPKWQRRARSTSAT